MRVDGQTYIQTRRLQYLAGKYVWNMLYCKI